MPLLSRFGFVFVLFLCAALPAAAATTITTYDRKSFTDYLKTVDETVETFEGYADGSVLKTVAGITYGVTKSKFYEGSATTVQNKVSVVAKGLASSGKQSIGSLIKTSSSQFYAFVFDQKVTFTFASEVAGFAIDINSFLNSGYKFKNGLKGTGVFTAVTDTGEVIKSIYDPFATYSEGGKNYGIGNFIGFTSSTPFKSLTLSSPGDVDPRYTFKLDTLVTVPPKVEPPPPPPPSPVPLPAGLPLLAAALGLMVALRRNFA